MSTAVSVVQEAVASGSAAPKPVPSVASDSKESVLKSTVAATGSGSGEIVLPPPPVPQNLQTHYDELLRAISEVGKDVKPAYTNSKISADRLKRNIAMGRTALRECLLDIERLNNQIYSSQK